MAGGGGRLSLPLPWASRHLEERPSEARRSSWSCASLTWSPTALLGVTRLPLPLLKNFWMNQSPRGGVRAPGRESWEASGHFAPRSPHGLGASASPPPPHSVLQPSTSWVRPAKCPRTTLRGRCLAPWHEVAAPTQGEPQPPECARGGAVKGQPRPQRARSLLWAGLSSPLCPGAQPSSLWS